MKETIEKYQKFIQKQVDRGAYNLDLGKRMSALVESFIETKKLYKIKELTDAIIDQKLALNKGESESTIKNKKWLLKKLVKDYTNWPKQDFQSFRELLEHYEKTEPQKIEAIKAELKKIEESSSQEHKKNVYEKWKEQNTVLLQSDLDRLQEHLDLGKDYLRTLLKIKPKDVKLPPTERGKRLGAREFKGTTVSYEYWGERAKKEWKLYEKLRSEPIVGIKRPIRKAGEVTVGMKRAGLEAFFGFLNSKYQIKHEDLTIKLLIEKNYLSEYYTYRKKTKTESSFIMHMTTLTTLVHNQTGFLIQLEKLFEVTGEGTKEEFEQYYLCGKTREAYHRRIDEIFYHMKNLKQDAKHNLVSSNKEHLDRISLILKEPRPLDIVFAMIERMYDSINVEKPSIKDVNVATAMAIFIVTANLPLRVKNLAGLTFGSYNDKESIFKEGDKWKITVPARMLKNRHGNIDLVLEAKNPEKYLNRYVLVVQNYAKVAKSRKDFRPLEIGQSFFRNDIEGIRKLMTQMAANYENNLAPKGINPHGMRYIVGTHVARLGLGMEIVGALLMDDINTAAKFYAQVKPQELIQKFYDKI